jgi:Family of unknown function (DUF6263)
MPAFLQLHLHLNINIMKQKIIQNLLLALVCITAFSAHAQKNNGTLQLAKGQKLQVDNIINSAATMEIMGQAMELNSDAVMLHQVEVKDKKDASYTITSTLTKMTTNGNVMGQSYSFDSDKQLDRDSSEVGKMLKGQLNVAKEIELNNKGLLVNQHKTAAPAEADANPMMGMMKSMTGSGTDFAVTEVFLVIPSGVKQGDSWSDSAIADGIKTYRTYSIKEISNNIATVTLTGTQTTNKTVEQMGSEVNLTISAKLSGESKVDIKTGMVQQKVFVVDGSGTADAMGQSIPLTMKLTSTTIVKSL